MKIQNRLLILVTLVTIIPTAVFSLLFYVVGTRELSTFIYDRVEGVNDVKKHRIEVFYQANSAHISDIAALSAVKSIIPTFNAGSKNLQSPELRAQAQQLKALIAEQTSVLAYDDIKLLNNEQRVLYVTNPDYASDVGTIATNELLAIAKSSGSGLHTSRPFFNQRGDADYEMYFAAPIKDQDGLSLGTVVLESEVKTLFAEINDSSGLSDTGETVLAVNDGYSALMLTPLKYDPQAALTKRINFGDGMGTGIQSSVRGQSGRGEITDYRGVTAFAAWSSIPELNWGIVTKIDKSEALSTLTNVGRYVMFAIPVIVVLMLVLFILIVRRELFGPLKHLTEVALKFAYGDTYPDINPKLMTPRDNMGQLAIALHQLRRTLRHGPPATAPHGTEAPDNYHHDEKPKDLHQE